jgi:hypothetical protein
MAVLLGPELGRTGDNSITNLSIDIADCWLLIGLRNDIVGLLLQS